MRDGRAGQGAADLTLTCRKMTRGDAPVAAALLKEFLGQDEFYLDASQTYGDGGPQAVERAAALLLARPELGFIWLVFFDGEAAGCCVVCYAISTSMGARVAKLDDVYVAEKARGQGAGTAMLRALADALRAEGVTRIDTSVHLKNAGAAQYYARLGFKPLNEERLAWVL